MNRTAVPIAVFLVLISGACAVRKQGFDTYRLVTRDQAVVLVPPGVESPEVSRRTIDTRFRALRKPCPVDGSVIGLRQTRNRLQVTVAREMLSKQPQGWLAEWAADLEERGCLRPGDGPALARRVAEALPLAANSVFRLLYSNQLDVTPAMRLQVVSPILREGEEEDSAADIQADAANPNSLTLTLRAPRNLAGFEKAWYAVRPKPAGIGYDIVPLYAERHIGGEVERRPQPAANLFRFPADAAFYRVFYKATATGYTALVIAARTPSELGERTRILEAGRASCEALNGSFCTAVPKRVAVNGFFPVVVNGAETMVPSGASLAEAIRLAGEWQPAAALPTLEVSRVYDGKPVAVRFDRASPAILSLVLTGGEIVSWK